MCAATVGLVLSVNNICQLGLFLQFLLNLKVRICGPDAVGSSGGQVSF